MVEVIVPATSANLGPGFDVLGLSINLYNRFKVLETDGGLNIEVPAGTIPELPTGKKNLVYISAKRLFDEVGYKYRGLHIAIEIGVPLGRGLGSSSTAIVGGLVAANEITGARLSKDDIFVLATEIEGHPDNVVPALLGGCRAAVSEGDRLVQAEIPVCGDWQYVLFIPDSKKSTLKARSLLARQVSREDAVFNLGRVALLTRAFITGDAALLRVATQDRLHQPQRQAIFPPMDRLFAAALAAGADGVFLAGSGPTIVAVARRGGEAIGQAMAAEAGQAGVSGRVRTARLDKAGAQIL